MNQTVPLVIGCTIFLSGCISPSGIDAVYVSSVLMSVKHRQQSIRAERATQSPEKMQQALQTAIDYCGANPGTRGCKMILADRGSSLIRTPQLLAEGD